MRGAGGCVTVTCPGRNRMGRDAINSTRRHVRHSTERVAVAVRTAQDWPGLWRNPRGSSPAGNFPDSHFNCLRFIHQARGGRRVRLARRWLRDTLTATPATIDHPLFISIPFGGQFSLRSNMHFGLLLSHVVGVEPWK
uniref:Uncharacterized protein n=1 Tax=Zea mays TaxID=4577 RepID=A0A804UFK7_MAIZE